MTFLVCKSCQLCSAACFGETPEDFCEVCDLHEPLTLEFLRELSRTIENSYNQVEYPPQ
jgi:hypothetical protein